jgi:hypothetical protein
MSGGKNASDASALPGDWSWAAEIDDAALDAVGVASIALLLGARRWVHRRVESVTLQNEAIAQRQVTLDFAVPPRVVPGELAPSLVPLAMLQKRKVRVFHLIDGSGKELPVLTRAARTELGAHGVAAFARGVLAPCESELRADDIDRLVNFVAPLARLPAETAAQIAASFFADGEPLEVPDVESARLEEMMQRLRDDDLFPTIAWNLATHFMLIAPIGARPGSRQRVTFSYEEPLALEPLDRSKKFWRTTGAFATRVMLPAAAAADAQSYHFEALAPEGLQISRSRFRITTETTEHLRMVRGPSRTLSAPNTSSDSSDWSELAALELLDTERGRLGLTHLYARDVPVEASGLMWLHLRPLPSTLLPPAVLTSGLVLLALMAAALYGTVSGSPSSAVALLLALPSVLAIYVVRPFENPMTTFVLFGVRSVVTVSGILAFLGAGSVAIGGSATLAVALDWAFTLAAGGCFVLLAIAFLMADPSRRDSLIARYARIPKGLQPLPESEGPSEASLSDTDA